MVSIVVTVLVVEDVIYDVLGFVGGSGGEGVTVLRDRVGLSGGGSGRLRCHVQDGVRLIRPWCQNVVSQSVK